MAKVGLSGLCYAPLTADTAAALTYGSVAPIPQVISLSVKRNQETVKLYADNGLVAVDFSAGDADVEIELGKMSVELRAALLGLTATAGLLKKGNIASSLYVALGWIEHREDGTKAYHWLLKGKFADPDDDFKTKGEKTEFQTFKLKGSFCNTTNNGNAEHILDESGTGYVTGSGATFIASAPAS